MTDNTKATAERESLTDWAWRLYGMLQSQGRISLHVMHEFATRIQIKGEEHKALKEENAKLIKALIEHDKTGKIHFNDKYAGSYCLKLTEEALAPHYARIAATPNGLKLVSRRGVTSNGTGDRQ